LRELCWKQPLLFCREESERGHIMHFVFLSIYDGSKELQQCVNWRLAIMFMIELVLRMWYFVKLSGERILATRLPICEIYSILFGDTTVMSPLFVNHVLFVCKNCAGAEFETSWCGSRGCGPGDGISAGTLYRGEGQLWTAETRSWECRRHSQDSRGTRLSQAARETFW
jgi:hypothetical protein